MSDPKEKEVQAILQAIDYGHLPPRETQRRLLNIIQAEAARTDAPTDETKIHTCMDLLERLQGEQKPIAPARVDALAMDLGVPLLCMEADCPRARGCPPAAHCGSTSEKRKKAPKAEENHCRSGLQCRGDSCRLCRIASAAVV